MRHIGLLRALILLSCLTACGGPKTYHLLDAQGQIAWRVGQCSDTSGGEPVSLVPSAGGWAVSQAGGDVALRELIRVDRENHRICLDAPAPRTKHPKVCAYGLMSDNEGDREETGYSTCNSAFTGCSFDAADAIFPPLLLFQAVVMTKACEPYVRSDKLWAAVQQTALLDRPRVQDPGLPVPGAGTSGDQLLAKLDEPKATPREVFAAPPPGHKGDWAPTPLTATEPVPTPAVVESPTNAVPSVSAIERERAEAELAPRLQIAQLGGFFSVESLQKYFVKNLNRDTLEHISSTNDALLVRTRDALLKNGRMYCFAELGLVERPETGKNPRLPGTRYMSVRKIEPDGDQSHEGIRKCRDLALETATTLLRRDTLSQQLAQSDTSRLKGKPNAGEKADPTTVHYYAAGLKSEAVRSAVVQAIPVEVRKAFDYRKLQWVLDADVYRLGDQTVCRGEVGVAARSPSDRSPRVPGSVWSATWEMTQEESYERDAEDTCKRSVLLRAVENALKESWDNDGLLSGFEWTKEDGVPLVAPVKRKASPPPPAQRQAPAPASPRQARADTNACQPPGGKVLRYSDRCYNGDCTRTFENGCSRRFQAPYCYDALRGEWGWKPDGC